MKKKLLAGICMIALLLSVIPVGNAAAKAGIKLSAKTLTIKKGKSKTLKVKNTKKTVSWKILSGQNTICLIKKNKSTVNVKGMKKGAAKVQAKVGKTKLVCKVTVTSQGNNAASPTNKAEATAVPSTTPIETEIPENLLKKQE